jgi:uncharacterized phage-associated protein
MPDKSLSFRFNLEKAVNALAYFASEGVNDLTTLKAAKLLYLADRRHLLQHGRPITGDQYIAMELGPVPEGTYQLITRLVAQDEIDDLTKACALKHLKVYRGFWGTLKYPVLQARRAADLDVFSDSEIAALDQTIAEYGKQPARDLVDLSHEHRGYRLADADRSPGSSVAIPYDYFFDEETDARVRELAEEQQEDRDFAEALRKAGRAALVQRETTATAQ